jgi:hypothetical protein
MNTAAAIALIVAAVIALLICPTIAAFIANSKFRSPGWWAVIGFFYGPLGVLAVIVVPDGHYVPKGWAKVTCGRCSATISVARVNPNIECWRCGAELS